jgi:hypothetical protein
LNIPMNNNSLRRRVVAVLRRRRSGQQFQSLPPMPEIEVEEGEAVPDGRSPDAEPGPQPPAPAEGQAAEGGR